MPPHFQNASYAHENIHSFNKHITTEDMGLVTDHMHHYWLYIEHMRFSRSVFFCLSIEGNFLVSLEFMLSKASNLIEGKIIHISCQVQIH